MRRWESEKVRKPREAHRLTFMRSLRLCGALGALRAGFCPKVTEFNFVPSLVNSDLLTGTAFKWVRDTKIPNQPQSGKVGKPGRLIFSPSHRLTVSLSRALFLRFLLRPMISVIGHLQQQALVYGIIAVRRLNEIPGRVVDKGEHLYLGPHGFD